MSSQNISTKLCIYGCGLNLYWNNSTSEYWEVFTKKKHICPNRSSNAAKPTTTNTKPTYYNKKPWTTQQPKPKMDNSLVLLLGSITDIQKQYEYLSDIIRDHGGKVHGSQRDKDFDGNLNILVYYEVPLGQRDEVKRKFDSLVRSKMVLQRN